MGIATNNLLTELRIHLGDLSDSELTSDEGLLLLNRSYWEIIDKFPFREKERTATFATIAGQRSYSVPSPFEAVRQLSIINPNSNEHKILERDTIYSHEKGRDTDDDAQGFPERYVRENNLIRLLPVPDDVYTITVKYWATLADLEADSTVAIPQSWHEMILYGGIWRGFLRLRDFNASNYYKIQQVALINSAVPVEAKEEVDSRTAHLEVLGRDY